MGSNLDPVCTYNRKIFRLVFYTVFFLKYAAEIFQGFSSWMVLNKTFALAEIGPKVLHAKHNLSSQPT